jgi:STE24 endopeptidase
MSADRQQSAKRYEAIHNSIFAAEMLYTLLLLIAFLLTGASRRLADFVAAQSGNPWLSTALFAGIVVVAIKLLFLPLNYFGEFYLEHRFGLSNQSLAGWALDELKSLGLNLALGVVVLDVLYFLLRRAGDWWWVCAGGLFLLFGIVISALFPVLILPLFYKLQPLDNESLKQKLGALAGKVGARVVGVYRLQMSAKTKKANAAFAGLGRTKRIIIGDTLLDKFSEDEIEVVMAHEMAHYRHGDIWRMIGWGAVTTFVGLAIADFGLRLGLGRFGFESASELGAFPLLALCLFAFGLIVMPLNNAFSRACEWKADAAALELTGNRDAFIRAMHKLAEQNLADGAPHPAIEFLLYDHPSLTRRIAWAEQWQPR